MKRGHDQSVVRCRCAKQADIRSIVQDLPDYLAIQIDEACEILRRGGVVAFPTDTVYGLGADVFNEQAVEKIFAVKHRLPSSALPVLVCNTLQVNRVAATVSDSAMLLMRHFWPGGLTIIMPKASAVPLSVTAGSDTIAVRMPDHDVPLALMEKLGVPLIGTSANVSGNPSPVIFQDVETQFGCRIDFIVRSNTCHGGIESTIVDITSVVPVIVRHGIIPDDAIYSVLAHH